MAVTAAQTVQLAKSVLVAKKKAENFEHRDDILAQEREIVARVLKGEKHEFKVLVDRYQNRVLAVAIGLVGNREDAEDLVQHAFLKAYASLKSFRGQSSFYTWLYRILYNLSIDLSRKAYRRSEMQVAENTTMEALATQSLDAQRYSGHIETPEEAFERGELRAAFSQALDELSDEHRSILMLREIDGLSYAEISETIGVTKGTVMSRLHHARKKIQKSLSLLLSSEASAEPDGELEQGVQRS